MGTVFAGEHDGEAIVSESLFPFRRRKPKSKATPQYVYAKSREEAQQLLDESYLLKFRAVPVQGNAASPEQIERWRREASSWKGDDYLWLNRFLEATQ